MADRIAAEQSLEKNQDAPLTPDLRDQVRGVGAQIRGRAEELGSQIKEGTQEAMSQVSASVSQLSEQGRAAVGQLEKTLVDSIRDKPLQAVLIAAGVGMLLGLLWKK